MQMNDNSRGVESNVRTILALQSTVALVSARLCPLLRNQHAAPQPEALPLLVKPRDEEAAIHPEPAGEQAN